MKRSTISGYRNRHVLQSHTRERRTSAITYRPNSALNDIGNRVLVKGRNQIRQCGIVGDVHTSRKRTCDCQAASMSQGDAYNRNVRAFQFISREDTLAAALAIAFLIWTLGLALISDLIMILSFPLVYLLDRKRRRFNHFINKVWAKLSLMPFLRVNLHGMENLPPSSEGVLYAANHQSIMDIFVLFLVGQPFKFLSKIEVFYVPIIGQAMWMTGHVGLKRTDVRSQAEVFRRCVQLLKEGVSILIFPEGTRSKDGKVQDFKSGAFKMAKRSGAQIVPISIKGTSEAMPHGKGFLKLFPGVVDIIIHKPQTQMEDLGAWSDKARDTIISGLG